MELAIIPRSTYYDLVKKMNRPDVDADLKAEIKAIYEENEGRYGYRRIRDELTNRGQKVNHKKVQRIMKELGLKCVVRMKKYKSYKGKVGRIAPNILERNFHTDAPNQKWVTDITEFKLFGEKLYVSPVLDLNNGFKIELEKYIDYYNTKRIKAKLKMSPVQYRTHFYQAA